MVNSRVEEEVMEMEPTERSSKPLHNFTLPCTLKWGNQKHLRCMKLDDGDDDDHHNHHHRRQRRRSPPSKLEIKNNSGSIITTRRQSKMILNEGQNDDAGEEAEEEEGIEAVREKIMMDLKTAADKMKDMILREEVSGEQEGSPVEVDRPWNLRTRRAACKAPIGGEGSNNNNNNNNKEERKFFSSSSSSIMRSDKRKEKEKTKFSVSLTKKEIEDDFMKMVGHKPPRRPKRRPKIVQKQMDTLFPGLWLPEEVAADSYKVDFPETGKR